MNISRIEFSRTNDDLTDDRLIIEPGNDGTLVLGFRQPAGSPLRAIASDDLWHEMTMKLEPADVARLHAFLCGEGAE